MFWRKRRPEQPEISERPERDREEIDRELEYLRETQRLLRIVEARAEARRLERPRHYGHG